MSKKILVVDDETDIRSTLADIVSVAGFDVSTAIDGQSAIQTLETQAIDLVLLDIMMPGLKTHQILKIISDNPKTKDIPIILVSAMRLSGEQLEQLAKIGRVVGYIAKPFDINNVITEVKKHTA